jgi:hypothetical protein
MDTTYRPISSRRLTELRGYVARSTMVFRLTLYVLAIVSVAWLLAAVHRRIVPSHLQHDLWWIVPTLLFTGALYGLAGHWTGGRSFRAKIRADLTDGQAAVHRVVAVDAIEVEQQEDEGPAFFVLTADGKTVLFAGQYLEAYKRKGFPWREFEILEAPQSKIFLGIVPLGDRLPPSGRRPPFTWDEFKGLPLASRNYAILDLEFETVKSGRITRS